MTILDEYLTFRAGFNAARKSKAQYPRDAWDAWRLTRAPETDTPQSFIYDYIDGSGFSQYPWYEWTGYDEVTRTLTVGIEDEDSEGRFYHLTPDELWFAYQTLLRHDIVYFSCGNEPRPYDNIDLDAGDADNIIQWACFGEIVYA